MLPLTPDLEPDLPALGSYLRRLLDEGVHGLAVNVDTGEGPHLDHGERVAVLRAAVEAAGGRVPVVAGLPAASTRHATAMARDFREAGADALLVFPSSVFRGRPLPPEVVVDYHRAVAEEGGVPLVLFQLQEALGGVELPVPVLVETCRLPGVVAIKEATFDRERFRETVAALRDVGVAVLTGNDNFIHESFVLGARGALIGFGTLATRMQVEMVEAHEAGDAERARLVGEKVQRLADVVFAPPIRDYRVRLKEALRMTGVIPGAAVRPPLCPLDEAGRETLRAALGEAGLL